eukprot:3971294-Ditylum_brightwellii.AAC.1
MQTGYDGYLGPNNLFIPENGGTGEYVGFYDDRQDIDARLSILKKASHAKILKRLYLWVWSLSVAIDSICT